MQLVEGTVKNVTKSEWQPRIKEDREHIQHCSMEFFKINKALLNHHAGTSKVLPLG